MSPSFVRPQRSILPKSNVCLHFVSGLVQQVKERDCRSGVPLPNQTASPRGAAAHGPTVGWLSNPSLRSSTCKAPRSGSTSLTYSASTCFRLNTGLVVNTLAGRVRWVERPKCRAIRPVSQGVVLGAALVGASRETQSPHRKHDAAREPRAARRRSGSGRASPQRRGAMRPTRSASL